MMVVEAHPLVAGHAFQQKETLQICIAEECPKLEASKDYLN
jgi:hypothetical protein